MCVLDLACHDGAGDALGAEGIDEAGEFSERHPVNVDGGVCCGASVYLKRRLLADSGDDDGESVGARGVQQKKGEATVTGDEAELFRGWHRSGELDANPAAKSGGDVDQGIEREEMNVPAQKVVDARLRNTAEAGRFGLSPTVLLDDVNDLKRKIGASNEIGRIGVPIGYNIREVDGVVWFFHGASSLYW